MTLPSSGPLSLSDIQTEFGGSNPISLSEYYAGGAYVPSGTTGTYGAVPSSGQISIQNFYGTSAIPVYYYVSRYVSTYNNTSAQPANQTIKDVVTYGTDGTYYVTGVDEVNSSTSYLFVAKFSGTTGAVVFSRSLGSSGQLGASGLLTDSSGNVYIGGTSNASSAYVIAKYNSSGSLQWQKTLSGYASSAAAWTGSLTALDASGNFIAAGRGPSSPAELVVAHLNSSGTVTSSYSLTLPSSYSVGTYSGSVVDSSGNIYHLVTGSSGASTYPYIIKTSSSGTVVATYRVGWFRGVGTAISIDTANNIYIGAFDDTNSAYAWVGKFNSSLTAQWGIRSSLGGYSTSTDGIYANDVLPDAAGNVYVFGAHLLTKLNSSGAVQWANAYTATNQAYFSGNKYVHSAMDTQGNLYHALNIQYNGYSATGWMAKVKANGTAGQTWLSSPNLIYSTSTAPSLTADTPSMTSGTTTQSSYSVSASSSGYTDMAVSMTISTTTYTP